MIRSLIRNVSGATAVEFALILPPLLALIFFVIEGNRMLWTKQAIHEAASNAARCMAVGHAPCDTTDGVRAFASERAGKWAVKLPVDAIKAQSNQTCDGETGMNRIDIDFEFKSPVAGLLPGFPKRLTAEACFPAIS